MSRANLPRQQAQALATMKPFAASISADPSRYGLSIQDAADLQAAVDALVVAYAAGNPFASRTREDIAAKDEAFAVAERAYRRCYSLIKWNDAVSYSDKVALGVRPVNRSRTRAVLDRTAPELEIVRVTPVGQHVLRYRAGGKNGTRKPPAATQLQLFAYVGDGPMPGPGQAKLCGCFSRSPCKVEHGWEDAGKQATYFARWVSQRGEVSAFSLPVSMTIAGGAVWADGAMRAA
jgi:hypothetical protein